MKKVAETKDSFDKEFISGFKVSKKYKKNRILIAPEEETNYLYYLKSGYVRLYATSQEGKELTLYILKPDSFFPLLSTFTNTANIYTYESLTKIEVLKIPNKYVYEYFKEHKNIFLRHTLIALRRLNIIISILIDGNLCNKNAYRQVASIILFLSIRFGKIKKNNQIIIKFPLTHRIIATLVGLTRESISREMEVLMKQKIISYKKHKMTIISQEKLEAAATSTLASHISYIPNNLFKL